MSALGKRGGLNIIRIAGLVEVTAPPPVRLLHRASGTGCFIAPGAAARPRRCGALAAGAAGPRVAARIRLRQVRRSLRRRASTSSGRAPALDGTHSDRDAARRRAAFARPSGQQARA